MVELSEQETQRLISRVSEISSNIVLKPPLQVFSDTTAYTKIYRGHIIRLGNKDFVVRGDVYEPRFGMKDQPKFWVKRVWDLESGRPMIMKLKFLEAFVTNIGEMRVPCFRSPEKEGAVLLLVQGDRRFMQGFTLFDDANNPIRLMDFIPGVTLYEKLYDWDIDHEEYYYRHLPAILRQLIPCLEAIEMLHMHHLCHGDIRNDHIIIDEDTGDYRWIDFDLQHDMAGCEVSDVWGLGNVLQFVIGKGLNPFYSIRKSGKFTPEVVSSLELSDAGVFLSYRLMNLKKIYPYISPKLNDILMRFSIGAMRNYRTVSGLIGELQEAIGELPGDTPC